MNIYLIDDDPDMAVIIHEMLTDIRGNQFHLECYQSLADGWKALEDEIPEVLLLDLGLPDSVGLEKVKKIHERFPSLPIIVLTSALDEELGVNSLQAGAQDYLVKGKVDARGLCRGIEFAVQRQSVREELQRSERRVQEAQRFESLGVLAGGIAHDFNNILTAILGNANIARQEIPSDSPIHTYLESIENSSLRAADICRQMLDYSGKGRFESQAIDLSRLVEETGRLLNISIHKKVELRFNLDHHLPLISGDPLQIRQVILNLATNASESIAGQGVITISTGICDTRDLDFSEVYSPIVMKMGRYAFLEVIDNGVGIEAKNIQRIFEPFYSTKFAGRGLGLPVVLGIARGHQGGITIRSSSQAGTHLRVYFPLSKENSLSLPKADDTSKSLKFEGRVLVVDDEEPVRLIASKILSSVGFQVDEAPDGEDALEILKKNSEVRFILLDMTMPKVDGVETLIEVRRLYPHIKILFTSGFSERDLSRRFLQVAPDGFVPKPFRADFLIEKVREILSAPSSREAS